MTTVTQMHESIRTDTDGCGFWTHLYPSVCFYLNRQLRKAVMEEASWSDHIFSAVNLVQILPAWPNSCGGCTAVRLTPVWLPLLPNTVEHSKILRRLLMSSPWEPWSGSLPVTASVHTQPCRDNVVSIDSHWGQSIKGSLGGNRQSGSFGCTWGAWWRART